MIGVHDERTWYKVSSFAQRLLYHQIRVPKVQKTKNTCCIVPLAYTLRRIYDHSFPSIRNVKEGMLSQSPKKQLFEYHVIVYMSMEV
jgi:hypothetical protein